MTVAASGRLAGGAGTLAAAPAGVRPGGRLRALLGRESVPRSPFLRWLLVNLAALALLAVAALQGWVATVVAGDASGLVLVIAAVFLFALAKSGRLAFELDRELGALDGGRPAPGSRVARFRAALATAPPAARSSLEGALKIDLVREIAPVRHLASALVLLGLVGTVLGFVMALSGVDAGAASDVSRIGPMVAQLIAGLGVALYTTLAGALLNIWAMLNFRLLEEAAARLLVRLLAGVAGTGE